MHAHDTTEKKHIIVIGGGFGGLAVIKHLKHSDARITLIDQRNHHLFQPLLYQVATTGLAAPDIAQPLRQIFTRRKDVRILMERVQGVDLEAKTVATNQQTLKYDYLVIAAGGETSYFGNDHWAKFAPGLKSLTDARQIRNHVLTAFEEAESGIHDEATKRRLMTMVIIGGGPTGVEMAGALAELSKKMIPEGFIHIDPRQARIVLVEAGDRVLSSYPESLSRRAQRQLEELGVELRLGKMVSDIRDQVAELKGGETIEAANICWTAGIGANTLTQALDVPKDKGGRLKVQPDFSLPGHAEAFAIGDVVNLVDANGQPVPGVAQGAMQAGEYVAKRLCNKLGENSDTSEKPFVYRNRGDMATIGRKRAVAKIGSHEFSGLAAWMLWLTIHLVTLIGLRNRLSVFLSWVSAYIWFEPGARIIWELDDENKKHEPRH